MRKVILLILVGALNIMNFSYAGSVAQGIEVTTALLRGLASSEAYKLAQKKDSSSQKMYYVATLVRLINDVMHWSNHDDYDLYAKTWCGLGCIELIVRLFPQDARQGPIADTENVNLSNIEQYLQLAQAQYQKTEPTDIVVAQSESEVSLTTQWQAYVKKLAPTLRTIVLPGLESVAALALAVSSAQSVEAKNQRFLGQALLSVVRLCTVIVDDHENVTLRKMAFGLLIINLVYFLYKKYPSPPPPPRTPQAAAPANREQGARLQQALDQDLQMPYRRPALQARVQQPDFPHGPFQANIDVLNMLIMAGVPNEELLPLLVLL